MQDTKIHRSAFLKEIKEDYPELREDLNRQSGEIYFEINVLLTFLQQKIDDGDYEITKILLDKINRFYTNGDKLIHVHIRDGICQEVNFMDSKKTYRSWALEYLCLPLRKQRDNWH